MNFRHLKKLSHVFRYQSPCGKHHIPRTILKGEEEIEVIVSGRGYFKDRDGSIVDVGPGSSVWFYENDLVDVDSHEETPYETIVFVFDVSGQPEKKFPMYTQWSSKLECQNFCHTMLNIFTVGNKDENKHLDICSYARLFWEASEYTRIQKHENTPLPLKKAINYINQNFQDNIDIVQIAEKAGVSSSHLHLLFREHLKISPLQLIIKHRLQKAQELLVSSDLNVKEICFESGFSDLNNFCSFFKRKTGKTPISYRNSFNRPL
jgi:AraC-like DNA-binding protein